MRVSDRTRDTANAGAEGTVSATWRSAIRRRPWCTVHVDHRGELDFPADELDPLPVRGAAR